MAKPKKNGKGKKVVTITFRPDGEVATLLDQAIGATGRKKSALINEAIRSELPQVVRRIIEDQQKHALAFFGAHASKGKKEGT